MKTFQEYLENIAMPASPAVAQNKPKSPAMARHEKAQNMILQKYGKKGTKITSQQVQEIKNIMKQQGQDPMDAPIVKDQNTGQAFIETKN